MVLSEQVKTSILDTLGKTAGGKYIRSYLFLFPAHGNICRLNLVKWLGDMSRFLDEVRRLEVRESKNS